MSTEAADGRLSGRCPDRPRRRLSNRRGPSIDAGISSTTQEILSNQFTHRYDHVIVNLT